MKLTFLSADKALTKTYIFQEDGTYDSLPYPLSSTFTSHEEQVNTIEDFYACIVANANVGRCLLRGNLEKEIQRSSRAGLTAQEATSWLLLDADGLDLKNQSVDEMLDALGLGNTDYILQYSASQGIKEGLNAHIFILLDGAYTSNILKQWAKHKNINTPFLREQLTLTKSNMSLHWPLDITVNQADKLIYIAPPNISGRTDPVFNRIELCKRKNERVALPTIIPNVDSEVIGVIKQLRSASGCIDHDLEIKYSKRDVTYIMEDPDKASVTGVKRNGDFTYLNLNGGDSWGYYHLTADPELLLNFKGEPAYKLQEIAPEYYAEAKMHSRYYKREVHRPKQSEDKEKYFIINKRDEGKYFKVTYKPRIGVIIDPAPTSKHINDFCMTHKVPIPDTIEDWTIHFDPTTDEIINVTDKTINLYRPTKYRYVDTSHKDIPDYYFKLFSHACGSDPVATDRFINWLAYIWQTGKKPKTAWVLHGTYGTGKGRLQRVLSFLFGDQCVVTTPENVNEHFNANIERSQILWIDEVTTDSWDNERITPKLRNWITEDIVSIRGMRKDARTTNNFMGIIIAANEHNPVEIRHGDRRISVAPRQEVKIEDTNWATPEIIGNEGWLYQDENLALLASALFNYKVDDYLATRPLENEAKMDVMKVTQNLPEDIVQALHQGNVSFFLEYIDPKQVIPSAEAAEYKEIVGRMMRGGRMGLATRDIARIFEYLAGWKQAPAKFSKAISKFGLVLAGKTAREGNRTFAGTYFEFNVNDQDRAFWAQLNDTELRLVREGRSA